MVGYVPCSSYQTTEQWLKPDYFNSKVHVLKLPWYNTAQGELSLSKRSYISLQNSDRVIFLKLHLPSGGAGHHKISSTSCFQWILSAGLFS